MPKTVKDRIEDVLKLAGRPLAPHEFAGVAMPEGCLGDQFSYDGRFYVGCSEATLGRRMREMVVAGRLFSRTREGKAFKEFGLAQKVEVMPAPERWPALAEKV